MHKIPSLTLIYFLTAFISVAQVQNVNVVVLNEANGLSSRSVQCFFQDNKGYIWIGTAEGLNRYDGYSFKTYRKIFNDSNSLISNNIYCIAEDKNHLLWIGYQTGGMSSFNPVTNKFTNYYPDDSLSNHLPVANVRYIYPDNENNLWIGTLSRGLIRLDITKNTFYNYGILPDIDPGYTPESKKIYNSVNSIYQSKDGLLWLMTPNGLYSYDAKKNIFSIKRNRIVKAYQWRDDAFGSFTVNGDTALWITTWGGGLAYYNMKTGEMKNFKFDLDHQQSNTHNIVMGIQNKDENELWITGTDKIGVFNKTEKRFNFFDENFYTKNDASLFNTIFADKEGNAWFAFNKGVGLIRSRGSLFNFNSLNVPGLLKRRFYSMYDIYKDTVNYLLFFATTYADGLHVLNEKTQTEKHITFDILKGEENELMGCDVYKDAKGTYWVITRDFIYQYNIASEKLVKVPQPPVDTGFHRSPFFVKALEDQSGNLWISTLRYGLYKLNPTNFSYRHFDFDEKDNTSLQSRSINSMAKDKLGRIWFGSAGKGLSYYDEATGKFVKYLHHKGDANSLINNVISGLTTDAGGNLWAATYGGLSKIEIINEHRLKFVNHDRDEKISSEIIFDIMGDNQGRIWFSSSAGLSVLNPETNRIKTFNTKDGLTDDYSSLGLYKTDDGEFFISTYRGYYRFYPEALVRKERKPEMVINSFLVFDKERPLANYSGINLSYKENFFAFDFASINFTEPEKMQYAYMLQGFDKEWINCGNRRYASYTNLDGGDYIFKVKAVNSDGAWSNPLSLPIHIAGPFWKKTWFIFLLALFVSMLIYVVYKLRINQIRKTEKLKTNFNKKIAEIEMRALRAQMNPHFIFNCLNSINRYIVKSDTKTASLYLTKFAKLIRLILDNSESATVALSSELESLKLYIEMESIRFENKFSYQIKTGNDLSVDSIMVPPLVIQPYVENAIWHGLLNKENAGNLIVDVHRNNGSLQFIIEDNGVGRTKAKELKSKSATTRKSLGMKITQDRIAILNEHSEEKSFVEIIDLKDSEGNDAGTKVIINIPLNKNS